MLQKKSVRLAIALGCATPLLAGIGIALAARAWLQREAHHAAKDPAPSAIELVPESGAIQVPPDVAQALGIDVKTVESGTAPRVLTLAGSLALDPNHLSRVHARFGGEVVEVGSVSAPSVSHDAAVVRQVQVGDRVVKGQLLATIWSKDLGEKKSELIDSLAQLRMSRQRLDSLEEGFQRQAIPEASVRQARRELEGDLNSLARAERTLRVWRLGDAEIDAIKQEYERIRERQGKRDKDKEREWAKLEIRAPFDGVILERNIALGDIVDTSTDLFKIADLPRLAVWVNAYENQLPDLLGLPTPIPWTVRLKADPNAPPRPSHVEMIGSIVDPTQHTAMIRGSVDNAQGKLRAGQFVTAVIELPADPNEVTIPVAALVEDGKESTVFVQLKAGEFQYTARRVKITRRGPEIVHVCNDLSPAEESLGFRPVKPGERLVTSGCLSLKAALADLQAQAKKADPRLVHR